MGEIHLVFGKPGSGKEAFLNLVRVEVDLEPSFHFSASCEEEERCLTLGLNSSRRGKLAFLLGSRCTLMLAWRSTIGSKFSLTGWHEEIPSIEEMMSVGSCREFLGAVLSKRARFRQGAETA